MRTLPIAGTRAHACSRSAAAPTPTGAARAAICECWKTGSTSSKRCSKTAACAREATARENEALKRRTATGDRGPGGRRATVASSTSERLDRSALPKHVRRGLQPTPKCPSWKRRRSSCPRQPKVLARDADRLATKHRRRRPADEAGDQQAIDRRTGPRRPQRRRRRDGGLRTARCRRPAGQRPRHGLGRRAGSGLEGEAARVARWDFRPDEVPSHFHKTRLARACSSSFPGRPSRRRIASAGCSSASRRSTARSSTPTCRSKFAAVDRGPRREPRADRPKKWSTTESHSPAAAQQYSQSRDSNRRARPPRHRRARAGRRRTAPQHVAGRDCRRRRWRRASG